MSRIIFGMLLVLAAGPLFASDEELDYRFNAADAIYDPAAMRAARQNLRYEHGQVRNAMFAADRLEFVSGDNDDALHWDTEAWYGGDHEKLIVKSSGLASVTGAGLDEAEFQVLWSHAMSPFFDLRTGLRYDLEPDGLVHLVIGAVGIAPYWLELEGAVYLSADGDLTAAIDVEYEWLFTQKLALQSLTEISASAQEIKALETGSGLNEISQSLRLRYSLTRQFIPYAGLQWSRAFGGSANLLSAGGHNQSELSFIAGINFWL